MFRKILTLGTVMAGTLFLGSSIYAGSSNPDGSGWMLKSGTKRVSLIELFSSEGCSSCPPADSWIASLRSRPDLWKSFVPIEFHVDYWNHLGWTDPFSRHTFTSRQQTYAGEWGNGRVYTPGFVRNGQEWRPDGADLSTGDSSQPGEMRVSRVKPGVYDVEFDAKLKTDAMLVTGAVLGNGLVSQVARGENGGRTLTHEFVVLKMENQSMSLHGNTYHAQIELQPPTSAPAKSYSVAFWVSHPGQQTPIQAVGGDIVN